MAIAIGVIVVIAFFVLIFLGASVRVLREYERGVIFRLGRLIAQKGPGLILLIPVIDRNNAIVEVENFLLATSQIAQTTLRSVLGKADLDQLLAERERLNEDLQKIIDEQTAPWGVQIITAEGEFQAAEKLAQAADIISKNPATLQLRYLQTLLEMGVNQNTTIVFPLPIEFIDAFSPLTKGSRT